jgi:hypothetical protein
MAKKKHASAGHKLGQLVGDWFEQYFVVPLLEQAANALRLFLDNRFRTRQARGEKIIWTDEEGNGVDYDFVMELDGTEEALGIPVAFFECFWRRGARHSKDKARDDSGKLLPMARVHPTARFLGILAGGDFTAPARALVQSRQIDLFYVPKAKIVSAFEQLGLAIDYPDRARETEKARLVDALGAALTNDVKQQVADALRSLVGAVSLNSYVDKLRAALGALPQEIRFRSQRQSKPVAFETIPEATAFLEDPQFDFSDPTENFLYEITYSDGREFERPVGSTDELKALHQQIERLAQHMAALMR